MQLDVRVDLRDAERYLTGLRKDQIPFATAYALTQTAKQAPARSRSRGVRVRREVSGHFAVHACV